MRLSSAVLSLMFAAAAIFNIAAQGRESGDAGEKRFRENAPKFHENFSAGAFEKNGPLVTPDIDVDSNNVRLIGRDNFVARIKRYSVPFPGMQLKDRVIIVDGNTAAVNYYLQGRHGGPYGKIAATGNNVQAMSGEVFEFNAEGLMKKLTTITDIHLLETQINGSAKVAEFQKIALLPNGSVSEEKRAKLRAAAASFDKNFNERHLEKNADLAAKNVRIDADNTIRSSRSELLKLSQRLTTAFPDMQIQDEYVLADGNRAAVEYIMQGTQTGPYTRPDGTQLAPTGRPVRVRGIDFMEFDRAGLLGELVVVYNESDFESQLTP
jgi:predicted ester cyclase